MPKGVVLCSSSVLNLHVEKKYPIYHKRVSVIICVCCTLYKLAQDASLVQCFESFSIGVTKVCKTLHDIVHAINVEFRSQI